MDRKYLSTLYLTFVNDSPIHLLIWHTINGDILYYRYKK